MLKRAYSLLEVKEITDDGDHWTIKGTATTPTPDRYLDEIDPMGAEFADSIALLWQHSSDKPVGRAELGKPTKKGIPYVAKLPKVKESGALRDRIEEAVQSIKYRLVAAVSIGFRVIDNALEFMGNGGIRFLRIEILELSLVTIPANAEATIDSIKSIDRQLLAASGHTQKRVVKLITPGVSGNPAPRRGAVQLIPRKDT